MSGTRRGCHRSLVGVVLLGGMIMLSGCTGNRAVSRPSSPQSEVTQGMLGDLNQYIHQLLSQRGAENSQSEKVLLRLLSGKGLPESEAVSTGRGR
ncbi:hypothetical protein ITK37_004640 [Salmonella enterica]|nr:hypothetical protein [Salmonella enterica]EBS0892525.1 hypothetical protein [Salmonella enterica subsp. enterica serovar Abaetetuba]ECE0472910.1 hypothetical protein [Salmonella enterica subsp. enterica serovar Glostrup]ECH8208601.1 hypothetical protein [Salmonella enterica subsp. enterica]EAX7074410.1 hypothetical protein [Salmonella enterica]